MMKIKKLHEAAVLPTRGTERAAGLDLTAVEMETQYDIITYHTGIAIELPLGTFGIIAPRSSIYKTGLMQSNSLGIIDSDYRGELLVKHRIINRELPAYGTGDRIAQLIILPYLIFTPTSFTEQLEESKRGSSGFGSTGN